LVRRKCQRSRFLFLSGARRRGLQRFLDGAKARTLINALYLRRRFQFAGHCSKDKAEMLFHSVESGYGFAGYGFEVVQTSVELLDLVG
jgi:hypothetical protein